MKGVRPVCRFSYVFPPAACDWYIILPGGAVILCLGGKKGSGRRLQNALHIQKRAGLSYSGHCAIIESGASKDMGSGTGAGR